MPFASHLATRGSPYASAASTKLFVHPVREKSRVETQIAIKLTLFPMPPGITKLHLQPHAISKPKLIAKPTLSKSPEMLEMYTMLVCTSAMQDPAKVQRALARAAGSPTTHKVEGRRSSSESSPSPNDDENKPLNGGPVNICAGCITRERKRAGRKKSKNKEEEEMWQEDEAKRIIVFNTHEVKDWQSPLKSKSGSQTVDASTSGSEYSSPPPVFPEDAMQVDLPMRIACYCRHQEEKLGFQWVLFLVSIQLANLGSGWYLRLKTIKIRLLRKRCQTRSLSLTIIKILPTKLRMLQLRYLRNHLNPQRLSSFPALEFSLENVSGLYNIRMRIHRQTFRGYRIILTPISHSMLPTSIIRRSPRSPVLLLQHPSTSHVHLRHLFTQDHSPKEEKPAALESFQMAWPWQGYQTHTYPISQRQAGHLPTC